MAFDFSSERVSKTGVGGTLLKEAKYINLSLHYLEQVFCLIFILIFINCHILMKSEGRKLISTTM